MARGDRRGKNNRKNVNAKKPPSKSVVKTTQRQYSPKTSILLHTLAGGRCEFQGCSAYLMEHHVTKTAGLFGQRAHIVAFQEDGPRGRHPARPVGKALHEVDNLMLLCGGCHKRVDDDPAKYSVEVLKGFKDDHEKRIRWITGLDPNCPTFVVHFKAKVRGQHVDVPPHDVARAIAPCCPMDAKGYLIDYSAVDDDSTPEYFIQGMKLLEKDVRLIYDPGFFGAEKAKHVSFFGMAPIPLLAYFGHLASTKITLDAFQRHRNPMQGWTWATTGSDVQYSFGQINSGSKPAKRIGLLISLSAKVNPEDVARALGDQDTPLFELSIPLPVPDFLKRRKDLEDFRAIYRQGLGTISQQFPHAKEIHLFAAVPAPIAVYCGHDRLPNAHPPMLIYQMDRTRGGYIPTPVRLV